MFFAKLAHRGFGVKPFQIMGIDHVAIGALDKTGLVEFWTDILGGNVIREASAPGENTDEVVVEFGTSHIDLMSPIDAEKKPKPHIPALNHIALKVDNIQACVSYLEEKGFKMPGGIRRSPKGHDVAFIHPKSAHGVLIELVQV